VLERVVEERDVAVPTEVKTIGMSEADTVVLDMEINLHFPEKMPEPALQHTNALVPLNATTVIAVGVPPLTKSADVPVARAVAEFV
jgi:hypothetical protein